MVYQQRMSPLSQLALLLGLCGAGLITGGIFTLLVAKAFLHVPLANLETALLDPANAELSRFLQVTGTCWMMALPAIFFAVIVYRKPFSFLGFNTALSIKQLVLIVLIMFAALFVSDMFGEFNEWIPIPQKMAVYFQALENGYDKDVVALTNMKNLSDYIISLMVIALAPAIFEEMVFRGCLQQVIVSLTRNVFWGIFITSALFSAFHQSYYGFLPRLFLGMALGYIFYYSKNIWLNILAHFCNNAVGVTQIYLISRQGKFTTEALEGQTFPWYYGLAAAAAVYFLFVVFKKESDEIVADGLSMQTQIT